MPDTVDVVLTIDAAAAPALEDADVRAAMGRMVSDAVLKRRDTTRLRAALKGLQEEARANGLTEEDVEDELRIYNSENRGPHRVDRP